ncbi:TRAP transporter small permease [Ferrovibrio xuzhouensis]|uniref:TRAP transporter small permease protein n=1 Tax=Ferrovibrio xuzhouensis TaxID=1576914 RepID=A0ABV7VIF4_9PROT
MFRSYTRLCRLLGNLFLSVSALFLLIMSLTVGWQVWGRYVLNETPISAEPLSLIFMLYLCLLGAAVGVREGYHMGMLVVLELLPPLGRRICETLSLILVGGFALGMIWYGGHLAIVTAHDNIPSVDLPQGVFYAALPLSGAAIVLFVIERLIAAALGYTVEKDAYRDHTA